ncbi:filaggrin-like isoform X2 [Cylas formicarius]|uniref:filaggrin-like isoform X2 n=1 Tax=Cylas formicarius TaxID=197179 RepID=UPI0029589502|nr:filaggrin-like isoform X2 [Cylas formicarius]
MAKKNKKSKFVPMTSDNEKRINATTQQRPSLEKSKTPKKRASDTKSRELGESSSLNAEPVVYTAEQVVCTRGEQELLSKHGDDAILDQSASCQINEIPPAEENKSFKERKPKEAVVATRTSPQVKQSLPDTMNLEWIKTTPPQGTVKPFSNIQQNLNPSSPEFKPRVSFDSSQNLVPKVHSASEIKLPDCVDNIEPETHQQLMITGVNEPSEDYVQPSDINSATTEGVCNREPHSWVTQNRTSHYPRNDRGAHDERSQFNQRRDTNYTRGDKGRKFRDTNISYHDRNDPLNIQNEVNTRQNRFPNHHSRNNYQSGDRGHHRGQDNRRSGDYQPRPHNQEKNFHRNQRLRVDQNQGAQNDVCGHNQSQDQNAEVGMAPAGSNHPEHYTTDEDRTPNHPPRNNYNKWSQVSNSRRSLNQQGYHQDRSGGSMRHQRHSTDGNDLGRYNNDDKGPSDSRMSRNEKKEHRMEDDKNMSQDSGQNSWADASSKQDSSQNSWADASSQQDESNNPPSSIADNTNGLVNIEGVELQQSAEYEADSSFQSACSHDQQTSGLVDWNDLTDPEEDESKGSDKWDTLQHQYQAHQERTPKLDNWRERPSNFKDPRMEREQQKKKGVVQSTLDQYWIPGTNADKEFKNWEKNWRKMQEFKNVKEVQQDLFMVSKEYSLAHCVAEDMRMGSGIAVQFKRDFKCQAELLQQKAKQGGLAVLESEGRHIYYLVTKRLSTGKPTNYTMWQSLRKLRDHMVEHGVQKVAVPRLGCGLDRLEWVQVKSMIQHVFETTDVEVLVCNFQQNYGQSNKLSKMRSVETTKKTKNRKNHR